MRGAKLEQREAERKAASEQTFTCRTCGHSAKRDVWPLRLGLMYCPTCVRRHGDMTLFLSRSDAR